MSNAGVPRPNARGPREKLRPREAEALVRLQAGEKQQAIADAMRVDKSQVSRWKRKFLDLGLLVVRRAGVICGSRVRRREVLPCAA